MPDPAPITIEELADMPITQQPTRPTRVLLYTWMEGIEIIEGLERFVENGHECDFDPGWPERIEQLADAMRRKIKNGK